MKSKNKRTIIIPGFLKNLLVMCKSLVISYTKKLNHILWICFRFLVTLLTQGLTPSKQIFLGNLRVIIAVLGLVFGLNFLNAQTIAEKKAMLEGGRDDVDLAQNEQTFLVNLNEKIFNYQEELRRLNEKVEEAHIRKMPEEVFKHLLQQIQQLRREILTLENDWQRRVTKVGRDEQYALWHQPETTIGQLVIDYGSEDYVYLVPPEIGMIPVSVNSDLPIPRSSWSSMLELVLVQNGINIIQLNPYLRQLKWYREDLSAIKNVTASRTDLQIFPGEERICFVVSPDPTDVRHVHLFLQKFSNQKNTQIQLVDSNLFIVGPARAIQELMKLYDFRSQSHGKKEYALVSLNKVNAQEMAQILTAIFSRRSEGREAKPSAETNFDSGLQVIILEHMAQALFLLGTAKEISHAKEIIADVDGRFGEETGKTVYWYTVKHSDAEELAETLEQVYFLLKGVAEEGGEESKGTDEPFFFRRHEEKEEQLVVNPARVAPKMDKKGDRQNKDSKNFIVDPKTGSIVMVVEAHLLPELKELLKRLDVPKKMVRIEVLLVEKKTTETDRFGLNLLRIGTAATNARATSLIYNDRANQQGQGILDFFVSRKKNPGSMPAYDFAYQFLVNQEGIEVNSCPSVTTVNQTEAVLNLVDEISVSVGTRVRETTSGTDLEDSYERRQYGITVKVLPTIHPRGDEEEKDSITLLTDITFDTPQSTSNDRPPVIRRHVENEVRVVDGETVIIGGLRRKNKEDVKDSIPFLGEIPGVGKLFSQTELIDRSTEMYFFITPYIIPDATEDMERLRCEELKKRPGDIPEFLQKIAEAKQSEKKRLFEGGMKMLFGS